MVSPTISSPSKIPPLSYADRAKKAQNIKSPISLQPRRIVVQTVSSIQPEASLPLSTSPSKPAPKSTNIDYTSDSSVVPTSTFPSHPTAPPVTTSAALTNGVKPSSNDLAEKALSIVAAHTSPPQRSPVVNVWNVRKEQMAAARSPATVSSQVFASQSMPLPPKSDLSPGQPVTPSKLSRDSAPNATHGPSASTTANGAPVVPPPIPSLSSSVDTDSWPEVGKLNAASISNNADSGQAPELNSNTREENQSINGSGGDQQLSVGSSRKSEKTKWIPIPAEELQATADALTKVEKRQNQSRKGPQNIQQHSNLSPPYGSSPGSGSTQAQSRLHSASQSASQSRVQSRSGSSQSSPRFPRGRKLPGDESITTGYAAPNPGFAGRSPGTSSPQLQGQHQLPLAHQSFSNVKDPAVSAAQPSNLQGQAISPPSVPYYPPTLHQPSAYLRASSHPPHNDYLTGQSTPPLQTSPYQPMYYIPFAPQPYIYWNASGRSNPGSGHHSPAYPPTTHMQGGAVLPSLPPHLPQFVHPHIQPHEPYAPRPRSETNPSLRIRPPPPHQSQAVGGYNVPFVGVSAGTNGTTETGIGEKPVVFGSIGVPGASKCPSPAPIVDDQCVVDDKPFTMFSIGVGPGDAGPSRARSRTVSSQARSRTTTFSETSEMRPSVGTDSAKLKVIDLTDSQDLKWEFGTVATVARSSDSVVIATEADDKSADKPRGDGGVNASGYEQLPPVLTSITGFGTPTQIPYELGHSPLQHPQALGSRSGSGSPPGQFDSRASGSNPGSLGGDAHDEFEVRDFGYGFGSASGSGYAETITRAERAQRQEDHRLELEREKAEKASKETFERETSREEKDLRELTNDVASLELDRNLRDADGPRPRRGSYYGGHERRGSGSFGGRRGRGNNGFGRGYNRGFQQHPRHAPPFNVTPPQTRFQPLVPMGEPLNGLYGQPRPLTTYIPTGYENYSQPLPPLSTAAATQVTPPVPVPISPISFPLDPIRWYLLGQLEYYLSPQNMVQDFFLRQQMDSKGWVPISLIASFNRVRQLTMDINLVRDVLVLSSVVQVKDDWVRMNGWEKFVLPDATASLVEPDEQKPSTKVNFGAAIADSQASNIEGDAEIDGDVEDDDDEDVVFVMDSEITSSGLTWTPEKQA